MKKIKRILASVMVLAMVLAVAPAAFATEYTGEGNASTDVTWTSGAMYIVTIPATVALGNTAIISASNVRLSVGETLNVKLTGTSGADNAFKLTSGSNELTYTVSKGTDNVAVGDVILSVPAGTATGEQVLTFNEPATAPNAGDYTGTVTFTISVAAATVPVAGVAITNAPTELTEGDTGTFTANVTPDDATDKTVTWLSSNTSILTVDATTGAYKAIAAGTATITATAGEKSATCTVTVKAATIPVTGVTLDKTTLVLTAGVDTATLTATVEPDTATDKTVTWASDNTEVATVDNGVVTPVAAGTATITATAGEKSASCTVTVNPATIAVTSVAINNAPTEALFVNTKGTLTATVYPDNATDKTVTWSSSDPDYVSIDAETGEYEVKGTKGYGSATITATAGDRTDTCTITGKVTYTSLSAGTVLHVGDTFYTGTTVYFDIKPATNFATSNGAITLVETKSGSNTYYKCQRGSNGTMPNWTSYRVTDNTDGVYIVSGSGTRDDKFVLAVHTKS